MPGHATDGAGERVPTPKRPTEDEERAAREAAEAAEATRRAQEDQ